MTVCVTGATGFIGAHVTRLLLERGDRVRVTVRSKARLRRLGDLDVEPIKADILDRAALRRAMRGCDLVVHTAGMVGARPAERVWQLNALAPRLAVEAAAAEDVRRVVVTSSSGAVGIPADGSVGDEREVYRGGLGLTYVDAKHEGESEALASGARLGVEVVAVNPAYVLGVPVDRSQPGETSTRTVGNYLRGRLPAVVEGAMNIVDVEDVARGHLLAAERGKPGERYLLGGYNMSWVELIDRIADLSGVHHPLVVLPRWIGAAVRAQEVVGLPTPIGSEAFALMGQNWRYSSRRARRELGFRTRPLERTLRDTIDWYLELIESGAFAGEDRSGLDVASAGIRLWERLGLVAGLRAAERYAGRRLVAGA